MYSCDATDYYSGTMAWVTYFREFKFHEKFPVSAVLGLCTVYKTSGCKFFNIQSHSSRMYLDEGFSYRFAYPDEETLLCTHFHSRLCREHHYEN